MNKTKLQVLKGFSGIYHSEGDIDVYFAPGRVNIIGEHIDYNGGHVFPCALSVGTYLAVKKRDDNVIRLFSKNCVKAGIFQINIEDISYDKSNGWVNYPLGVFKTLIDNGYKITHGYDLYYYGNIPGSGLSSSASIEVVTAYMLRETNNFDFTLTKLAKMCQESENKFNGLSCGIMDQYASALGKRNCAMFLDTATLKHEYIKMNLEPYQIVVINSQVPHSLTSSHYNDRLNECQEALKLLQTKKKGLKNLCELSLGEFNEIADVIYDPIIQNRARFAVEEEQRVKDAIDALNEKDIVKFGELLTASGDGLKYDYEATIWQIDALVDICLTFNGCLGSRETGGGWGGNIIALVKKDQINTFQKYVYTAYKNKTKLKPTFLNLVIGDGVHKVK